MPVSTKVTAATLAAAISSIALWILKEYAGVNVPQPVEGAIIVLLTLGVGYLVPETAPAPSAVETIHARESEV